MAAPAPRSLTASASPARQISAAPTDLRSAVRESYAVYAHHVDSNNRSDLSQYMGVVYTVIDREGVRYIHVRGGLQHANELFIPITAVRAVVGKQVHLALSPEELAGRAWHLPPLGYRQ